MKPIGKKVEKKLASGESFPVFPVPGANVNGQQYRFTVVGAGTADIQPIIDGQSTHKPETVNNDTVILDYTWIDNFVVTVSGGAATVRVSVFAAA